VASRHERKNNAGRALSAGFLRSRLACRGSVSVKLTAVLLAVVLLAVSPTPAAAYVGPGAGFVFVTSFLVILVTGLVAFVSLLLWPFRALWRLLRRATRPRPRIKRLVIVGFDGQDPRLTDRFMAEGKLPNFKRLAEDGCYHPLQSTFPSVSPVAWSSFSTGTHPAKHNIYDFLDRDTRTYLPVLSSTRIAGPDRVLRIGRYRVPLGKPDLRLLRKSRPFWSILGQHQIWSTVLRVPITFPPDRFYGAQLSAMCVPDLLGTQGTFTLVTTRDSREGFKEGGRRVRLSRENGRLEARLEGPENELVEGAGPMSVPLVITPNGDGKTALVEVDGASYDLQVGELTDWVDLSFRAAPGIKVRGICRMMLTETGDHVSLYVTPINLDPERPAMPISHPSYYAIYLAKKLGKYATLGLAEDTWALNEGVIDDATFLRQTYDIDQEREDMFFAALDTLRKGTVVCVFDATDRIQHMFWRYLEDGHPAARMGAPGAASGAGSARASGGNDGPEASHRVGDGGPKADDAGSNGRPGGKHADAIQELYIHNDQMVGRIRERLRAGDVLMVLSDHGFTSFRRGVNLNAWLHDNGYLTLKDGADGRTEWLREVDWSRTRAYALGLTGLYLNIDGREAQGTVRPGDEARELKAALVERLSGLPDDDVGHVAIREAFDTSALYGGGPYLRNAPDLLIGYAEGYRASWDGATGVVHGPVIEDNVKPWSGDHCVDPRVVPGVFFSDRPIDRDDPALIDIAPTALWLFGLRPPAHMDGKLLFDEGAAE
jgi:predicted AlkP superfamily phosphohydrolase/phosphomutase